MAAGPPASPAARFPLADGLRAVAALSILVHHVGATSGFAAGDVTGGRITSRLDVGVAVFFVLSAFLLYRPWLRERLTGGPPPALARYARRRALRILPAYWVALVVLGLLGWAQTLDGDWWRWFSLTQVYDGQKSLGGLSPAWSLCVEASFYLALPLWAAGARRLLAGRPVTTQVRAELVALAGLAFAALLFRWAIFDPLNRPSALSLVLPGFLDWFALGMALALASVAGLHRIPRAGLAWAGAVLVLVAAETLLDLPRGFVATASARDAVLGHLAYGIVAALLALPVLGAAPSSLPARVLGHPLLVGAGVLSYGIFLYNLPLAQALGRAGVEGVVVVLATTLAGSVVLAGLSWRLVERPLLGQRGRGASARARRPAASSPATRSRAAQASNDAG